MVMTVMSAVCVLLGDPTDWNSIKLAMAEPVPFLKRLTALQKNKISDRVIFICG